jgi:uncharacterized protein (DUF302 family)
MVPTRTDIPIRATRVDYRSSVGFDTALSRLRASIQKKSDFHLPNDWPDVFRKAVAAEDAKAAFTKSVLDIVGPHGFMHFLELNHGAWLPIFDAPTSKATDGRSLKSIRFILGNPLIAIGMIKYDITAGLYAPTELLIVEEDEGTRVTYQLPSGLVAGYEGASEGLKEGAAYLDGKLEALVQYVLSD